jgi:chorismate--pyruvate lyase
VREVELMGSERPVVNARSLIPLTDDTKDILKIGSRPLGEILFNDPEIKRGHLEVGSFNNSWARRSTFTISKTNLLVTEIFLESLYA